MMKPVPDHEHPSVWLERYFENQDVASDADHALMPKMATAWWIEIVQREQDWAWLPTLADIMKSALLARLCSGKKPFKIPPPKAYSYPWYDLIEKGYYAWNDVAQPDGGFYRYSDQVSIAQDPGWTRTDSGDYTYTGRDQWVVQKIPDSVSPIQTGARLVEGKGEPVYATHWLLRIDDEDIW